jgi:hypothetical protein
MSCAGGPTVTRRRSPFALRGRSDTADHPWAGLLEGLQVNTIEPSPQSEGESRVTGRAQDVELRAGDELVVYLQLQVNPTTIGE